MIEVVNFLEIFSFDKSGVYIGKGGAIMPATMTHDRDTLVLCLATLGGAT